MNVMIKRSSIVLFLVVIIHACSPAPRNETATLVASNFESITAADYERAQSFLAVNTSDLVRGNILAQYWQIDDRLIYRRSTENGSDYILVDVKTAQKSPLFDAVRLALELEAYAGDEVDASDLNLTQIHLAGAPEQLKFNFAGESYVLDLSSYTLNQLAETAPS